MATAKTAAKKAAEAAAENAETAETAATENAETEASETAGKPTGAAAHEAAARQGERRFTKSKLVGSRKFAAHRDILAAKLRDAQLYTVSECEGIIEEFLKGRGE